ncbi:Tetratricopeptide repeat protein 36 [Halotydeus destructor]|nr:Tetratricopeptide repeat protein 36 [Halotydeus destructor]
MCSSNDKAVLNAIFNPELPSFQQEDALVTEENETPETPEEVEAAKLEVSGVTEAENNNLDKAIELFNDAINLAPSRASGYNNRAQVFQLRGDTQSALNDLNRAIELSKGKGKAASNAYCQRAMIHRLEGRDEEALSDFKLAAVNGSEFAKSQVVKLNPYAALCNQMLGDMMAKLQRGEPIGD